MSALKKISLKDIAEAAGVSTALVSFVLNGKKKEYRVGEETAKRILKIAQEMNYQPNIAAKSLRSGRTKTIGVVISDISNPFFSQLARILEDEATKRGYTVLFGSSDEDTEKMNRVVSNLINKGVDGLIIVPCENSEKSIASLVDNNVPIVLFDRYFPEINVSYVALNNYNATYTATKYLLDSGYNAPCIVAYDINLIHMKERIRGYKKAMEDAGKKRLANVIFLKQVINKIGLVGFDGTPAFDFFSAPVSYVQQPAEVLVQKALGILIDNIANGNTVQSVLADGVFIEITP